MSIRIVTDSSCDLPEAVVDAHDVRVVPLSIRFGDEELIDREQLSTSEFWARCAEQDTLPETAAPAPGQFEAAYRELAAEGATVGLTARTLESHDHLPGSLKETAALPIRTGLVGPSEAAGS